MGILLGKYRFSYITAAGFIVGLIWGMLFGEYRMYAYYGASHYGWAIWIVTFFVSVVLGIFCEIIYKKTGFFKKKKNIIAVLLVFIINIIIATIVFNFIPKYPQPEYMVETYDRFIFEISDMDMLYPSVIVLDGAESEYVIYLEDRFSHNITGYLISYISPESNAQTVTVECRLKENEKISYTDSEMTSEKEVYIENSRFIFENGEYMYTVHFNDNEKENAKTIVHDMLEK